MSTKLARSLQPDNVPHEDAIFNVSRSSLLVAALTQSPELLFEATEDKLHQDYRAEAMPQTSTLIKVLRDQGFAAVVSGAGPSILVLCSDPAQRAEASALVASHEETPWTSLALAVDFAGAQITDAN
jgi:homoserine kinase